MLHAVSVDVMNTNIWHVEREIVIIWSYIQLLTLCAPTVQFEATLIFWMTDKSILIYSQKNMDSLKTRDPITLNIQGSVLKEDCVCMDIQREENGEII